MRLSVKFKQRWGNMVQFDNEVTLRWIWVSHAQRLYGDKLSYDDPASLTQHIQSEFESRLHWDWNKMASKNAKAHNTTCPLFIGVLAFHLTCQ